MINFVRKSALLHYELMVLHNKSDFSTTLS